MFMLGARKRQIQAIFLFLISLAVIAAFESSRSSATSVSSPERQVALAFPASHRQQRLLRKSQITENCRRHSSSSFVYLNSVQGAGKETAQATRTIGRDQDGSRKSLTLQTLVGALAAVSVSAKAGILRGPLIDAATNTFGPYTNEMIFQDVCAMVLTGTLGFALSKGISWGFEQGYYGAKVGRKLIHTLSAPLFILFWPVFSEADGSRFFAAIVPLVNMVRLYLAGTGEGESSLANSVSRSGDKSEALGGPFIYVSAILACICLFWKSSFIGIIALCTLGAGDGMADLVGRKWGRNNKWFFSEEKSIAGTVAFATAASLTSIGLVIWLISTGSLQTVLTPTDLAIRITGISVAASLVELLPIGDDNYTVPLSAALLAALLIQ